MGAVMNCDEVQKQIELHVLDDLTDESSEIQAHLATCLACRTLEMEYRRLVTNLVQSVPAPGALAGLAGEVVQAVEQEIRDVTRWPTRRGTRVKIAALAASLLICLGVWQFWPRTQAPIEPSLNANRQRRVSFTIPAQAMSVPTSAADNMVVRDRNIYLLQESGVQNHLVALNTETGLQIWDSHVDCYGYLALGDTQLYCLAPHGNGGLDLVAVDVSNGRTLWRHTQNKPRIFYGLCAPVFLPGGSICWTVGNTMQVLRSKDGALLWSQDIPGEQLLSSAVADKRCLYVAGTHALYQLDIHSGARLWQTAYELAISRWVRPMLAAQNNQLCVALRTRRGQSVLMCISSTHRKTMWSQILPPISHLCAAQHRIYIRSQGILALDLASGDRLWQVAASGCSPITHAEGRVWFADASDQGDLIALDAGSGTRVSALSGLRSCNALIEFQNRAYVKTHDGDVHVIHLGG